MVLKQSLESTDEANAILEEKLAKQEKTSKVLFKRLRALEQQLKGAPIESQDKGKEETAAIDLTKSKNKVKKRTAAAMAGSKNESQSSSEEEGHSSESGETDTDSESE